MSEHLPLKFKVAKTTYHEESWEPALYYCPNCGGRRLWADCGMKTDNHFVCTGCQTGLTIRSWKQPYVKEVCEGIKKANPFRGDKADG